MGYHTKVWRNYMDIILWECKAMLRIVQLYIVFGEPHVYKHEKLMVFEHVLYRQHQVLTT